MAEPTDLVAEHDEPHDQSFGERLNWLRAGVLGAGDGIVSTAGLVIGVAAATTDRGTIWTAGLAGLAAGAMSMAVGEYVSVSTQRDAEMALLAKERRELQEEPEAELQELAELYEAKGLSPELAHDVAVQLTAHDALAAHAETELGIDPEALTKPWHAAWASLVAFTVGALIPLVAILAVAPSARVPVTVVAVVLALLLTGWVSARLSSARVDRAVWRNIAGGLLAMGVTYLIGLLVGTQVG
ncbi:membrane protein [Knoellia flava TL1]|uniref:Membrane protein n=2 Tax=Knoellia flava TaxID=913969 RepID=A0A8H9FS63_9MICO|nr:VIT family protein [Knoellia flava]KGN33575.1 membrane protein [Knoellia flava TL1]GGB73023.1 membrane protein [Knoellia flava]